MPDRTCTMPGCSKTHRARGLCSTHYNQANPRTVQVHCAQCDKVTTKEPGSKYVNRFCSYRCRDEYRWWASAARSSAVPNNHPSRSTPVPVDHPSRVPITCDVPADHPSRFGAQACRWCGGPAMGRYCSMQCKRRAKHVRRKSREADNHVYSWTHVMRVLRLLDGRCAYCEQVIVGQPDPDHVIPLSRHGSNGDGNVLPSCRLCNSDKRDLLLHEWADDRARRGKSSVRTVLDRSRPAFAHLLPTVFVSSFAPGQARSVTTSVTPWGGRPTPPTPSPPPGGGSQSRVR